MSPPLRREVLPPCPRPGPGLGFLSFGLAVMISTCGLAMICTSMAQPSIGSTAGAYRSDPSALMFLEANARLSRISDYSRRSLPNLSSQIAPCGRDALSWDFTSAAGADDAEPSLVLTPDSRYSE